MKAVGYNANSLGQNNLYTCQFILTKKKTTLGNSSSEIELGYKRKVDNI